MTHEETVTVFFNLRLRDKDLVRLTLINGETVTGYLNVAQVGCELNENGEKINSRIGLLPPPPPVGYITTPIITPFYSSNILTIERA